MKNVINMDSRSSAIPKKKSIFRNLALGQTLIMLTLFLTVSTILYLEYSNTLYKELQDNADEHIDRLAQILVTPIWTYDYKNIEAIGSELTRDKSVHYIKITDNSRQILFEYKADQDQNPLIYRKRNIIYNGRVIGTVEISLTSREQYEEIQRLLKLMLSNSFLTLIVIVLATWLLLRIFLRSPVKTLEQAIDDMASGAFTQSRFKINYSEFSGIITRFVDMAYQVKSREKSWRIINAELESEINERKRTQEALLESEAILRATLESTMDGVLVVSANGQISHYNSRFCDIWSAPPEIISTRTDRELIEWVKPQLVEPIDFQKRIDSIYSGPELSEDVIPFKDGRYIERFSYPLQRMGAPSGRVWYFRDITDRVRSAETEKQLEAQLRHSQKMEALGTLAGGIAHDFNNILTAIVGYCELNLQQTTQDSPLYKNTQKILKASKRARDLIRQILTFSRQTELEKKPVNVAPIIREAINFLRPSLPSTIKIELDILSDGAVLADPIQIYQLILNICTNASHAMRENGGLLGIKLEKVNIDQSQTSDSEIQPGQYLKLSISDTGHGIDPDSLERIFEPFYTTKSRDEGSGMGLSVVHGIVKGHGGHIEVQSTSQVGTHFYVLLPITRQKGEPDPVDGETVPQGHEHILFVDDEITIVEVIHDMLDSIGYRVTTCTGSTEALRRFNDNPNHYDLVITDMTMPHMTGDVLAEHMIKIRPDIPIIICSGYNDKLTEERAREIGLKGFMMKPFVLKKIARLIRKVMDETKTEES